MTPTQKALLQQSELNILLRERNSFRLIFSPPLLVLIAEWIPTLHMASTKEPLSLDNIYIYTLTHGTTKCKIHGDNTCSKQTLPASWLFRGLKQVVSKWRKTEVHSPAKNQLRYKISIKAISHQTLLAQVSNRNYTDKTQKHRSSRFVYFAPFSSRKTLWLGIKQPSFYIFTHYQSEPLLTSETVTPLSLKNGYICFRGRHKELR